MRPGSQRYFVTFAGLVAYVLLGATRIQEGTTWPILAAYGVAVLIAWRTAWHRHLFDVAFKEDVDDATRREAYGKYQRLFAAIAAGGLVITSLLWFF